MNSKNYIDQVASKVNNEELRARLREELEDHWEEYSERQSVQDMPQHVLGDGALVAQQTNAVALNGVRSLDVLVSMICGLFTMASLWLFRTLLFPYAFFGVNTLPLLQRCFAVAAWLVLAWHVYLALQQHLFLRYGRTAFRTLLLVIAFFMPCAFAMAAAVSLSSRPFSYVASLAVLCGAFFWTERLALLRSDLTGRILSRLRLITPLVLAVFVATGLVVANDDGPLHGAPYAAIVFLIYGFWCFVTTQLSLLLALLGISKIFAIWSSVALFLAAGIGPFLLRLARRKPVSLTLRLMASVFLPIAAMLPLFPKNIPTIEWKVPVVWTWNELERRQLNLMYFWANPLMRFNEGVSVSYAAYPAGQGIGVVQEDGSSYLITRAKAERIGPRRDSEDERRFAAGLSEEVAAGFACDGHAIEVETPGIRVRGYEQIFSPPCRVLTYDGTEIANLDRGSLMDLDLSDDGLLAISIGMGVFNPTYVYVVDAASVMEKQP